MKKMAGVVIIAILAVLFFSCDLLTQKPRINPADPDYVPGEDPDYVFYPPTSLDAEDQGGSVVITWVDNVDDEEGFILQRRTGDSGDFTTIFTSGPDVETYTDESAVYNNTYFYHICSFKGAEESYYSEPVSVVFFDTTPPEAVPSLNASVSNDTITLSWIMPTGHDAAGLLIVRSTGPITWTPADDSEYTEDDNVSISEKIILIDEVLEAPYQYVDAGLPAGTTCYYAIFLFDEFYNYSAAETAAGNTPSTIEQPTVLGLTDDTVPKKSKTWNWYADTTGAEFRYLIDTIPGDPSDWGSAVWATTQSASQPSGDGTFYIHVQARLSITNLSEVVTVSVTLDNTPPAAPVISAVTPTNDTTPRWDWEDVDGADRYRYGFSDGAWLNLNESESEYTPGFALSPIPYTLYVQAGDTAGNWSASASSTVVIDVTAPELYGLSNDSVETKVKTWNWTSNDENAEFRYIIDQSEDEPSEWTGAAWGSSLSTSQPDGDGTYYLHLQARDEAGNVSSTATVYAELDNTPPNITGLSDSSTPVQSVSWVWSSDNNGDAQYRHIVDQTTGDPSDWSGASWSTATSASQPGGNGTYYLHVQARDPAGNVSDPLNVSAVLDNTPPVISLTGDPVINLIVGQTYTELGATASDNIDTGVSVTTGGDTVETGTEGVYTVTYNAVDTAGNAALEVIRTVNMIGEGNLLVTIDLSDPDDIVVDFNGSEAVLSPLNQDMSVSVTVTGAETYQWFLDGTETGTDSASLFIDGSGLDPGLHFVDLFVTVTGGDMYSAGFDFRLEN